MMKSFPTSFACLSFIFLAAASSVQGVEVFRKNNIDYLNAETLQYFLNADNVKDYDVTVMFYASWDSNSRRLAPAWGQIAKLTNAGSQESSLIVGLFDCETTYANMQACTDAGITHYPTILYFSSIPNMQSKKPKHVSKFNGNWQYTDSILDWVNTMRALSKWHRKGFGQRIRQYLFGKKEIKALPIGVPSTATGAAVQNATNDALISKLTDEKQKMKDVALRSSSMIEALLFPAHTKFTATTSDLHRNFTDVFALLESKNGWSSSDKESTVLRTCAADVALDYCSRFAELTALGYFHGDVVPSTEQVVQVLKDGEPYCLLIESCIREEFKSDDCRPSTCPFHDMVACRYLTSCLFPTLERDYAKALGYNETSESTTATSDQTSAKDASTESAGEKKKKGWGFA